MHVEPVRSSDAHRVLLAAPTRRDVEVTRALLDKAGVHSVVLGPDARSMATQLDEGADLVLLADEALSEARVDALLEQLARQPAWSDLPVVLLTRHRDRSPAVARMMAVLTNVTLLDSPVSTGSLVSTVLAALRARRRQYQLRDQWTAQRKAEEALRDADRRKDEFLATLSHELRNPLAPIRTGLQALARTPGDCAQAEQLRRMMERQVQSLVRLIDDLLDVSRIATGKLHLDRERVDLRTVVDAALESSRPLVDAAGHELRIDWPDDPVWVLGDACRLSQGIGNLVTNAAKYTPDGGCIVVSLAAEANDAVVRVVDNGAGIPQEMLDQVFDLFTQVDRTLDRAQGGLGIGLSLVRRLIELHGGSVVAASDGLGHGSTFTVRLPAIEAGRAASSGPCAPVGAVGPQRRMRLLVVDDNVDAADTLALLLAASGHELRTAYDGVAALEAVRAFRPEVVFCDIGLPGMDGYTIATRLRSDARNASTVLVAVSGWGTEEIRLRARNAGFDFHLVKPVDVACVEALLDRL